MTPYLIAYACHAVRVEAREKYVGNKKCQPPPNKHKKRHHRNEEKKIALRTQCYYCGIE